MKNITVYVDGKEIGKFKNRKELHKGKEFSLEDGSILSVSHPKYSTSFSFSGISFKILHNGRPLPNTDSDPRRKLASAYGIIFFIGGLRIVVGLFTIFSDSIELGGRIGGLYNLAIGIVFVYLGFLVRGKSMIALAISLALFSCLILLDLASGVITNYFFAALFGFAMFQGFRAIKDIRKEL